MRYGFDQLLPYLCRMSRLDKICYNASTALEEHHEKEIGSITRCFNIIGFPGSSGSTQTEESDLGFTSWCVHASPRHAHGRYHICFCCGSSAA
jgi:hypothetical protein